MGAKRPPLLPIISEDSELLDDRLRVISGLLGIGLPGFDCIFGVVDSSLLTLLRGLGDPAHELPYPLSTRELPLFPKSSRDFTEKFVILLCVFSSKVFFVEAAACNFSIVQLFDISNFFCIT